MNKMLSVLTLSSIMSVSFAQDFKPGAEEGITNNDVKTLMNSYVHMYFGNKLKYLEKSTAEDKNFNGRVSSLSGEGNKKYLRDRALNVVLRDSFKSSFEASKMSLYNEIQTYIVRTIQNSRKIDKKTYRKILKLAKTKSRDNSQNNILKAYIENVIQNSGFYSSFRTVDLDKKTLLQGMSDEAISMMLNNQNLDEEILDFDNVVVLEQSFIQINQSLQSFVEFKMSIDETFHLVSTNLKYIDRNMTEIRKTTRFPYLNPLFANDVSLFSFHFNLETMSNSSKYLLSPYSTSSEKNNSLTREKSYLNVEIYLKSIVEDVKELAISSNDIFKSFNQYSASYIQNTRDAMRFLDLALSVTDMFYVRDDSVNPLKETNSKVLASLKELENLDLMNQKEVRKQLKIEKEDLVFQNKLLKGSNSKINARKLFDARNILRSNRDKRLGEFFECSMFDNNFFKNDFNYTTSNMYTNFISPLEGYSDMLHSESIVSYSYQISRCLKSLDSLLVSERIASPFLLSPIAKDEIDSYDRYGQVFSYLKDKKSNDTSLNQLLMSLIHPSLNLKTLSKKASVISELNSEDFQERMYPGSHSEDRKKEVILKYFEEFQTAINPSKVTEVVNQFLKMNSFYSLIDDKNSSFISLGEVKGSHYQVIKILNKYVLPLVKVAISQQGLLAGETIIPMMYEDLLSGDLEKIKAVSKLLRINSILSYNFSQYFVAKNKLSYFLEYSDRPSLIKRQLPTQLNSIVCWKNESYSVRFSKSSCDSLYAFEIDLIDGKENSNHKIAQTFEMKQLLNLKSKIEIELFKYKLKSHDKESSKSLDIFNKI